MLELLVAGTVSGQANTPVLTLWKLSWSISKDYSVFNI